MTKPTALGESQRPFIRPTALNNPNFAVFPHKSLFQQLGKKKKSHYSNTIYNPTRDVNTFVPSLSVLPHFLSLAVNFFSSRKLGSENFGFSGKNWDETHVQLQVGYPTSSGRWRIRFHAFHSRRRSPEFLLLV